MKEETKALKDIIKSIYKIATTKYSGKFQDDDWHHVYDMVDLFYLIDNVDDVTLSSGRYVNYFDFDNDKSAYRDYNLTITTKYGKLTGYIRCFGAGTEDNIFSSYDMIVYINEQLQPLDEMNINVDALLKEFKQKIKNIKSVADLTNISKQYLTKGLKLSIILTVVFSCMYLDVNKKYKYLQSMYAEQAQKIELIQKHTQSIDAKWELVSDAVQATIYNAVPEQCNKDIIHTASMFEINLKNPEAHKIIAMERTMMKKYGFKYGDLVKITGTKHDGIYQIQDTMNKRFKNQEKIDILVNNDTKYGMWDNIKIYKLMNPDECYNKLKEDMLPANNQDTINRRQKH